MKSKEIEGSLMVIFVDRLEEKIEGKEKGFRLKEIKVNGSDFTEV